MNNFTQPSEWNLSLTPMISIDEPQTTGESRESRDGLRPEQQSCENRETTNNKPNKKYNPSSKFYDIYFRKYN